LSRRFTRYLGRASRRYPRPSRSVVRAPGSATGCRGIAPSASALVCAGLAPMP